TFTDLPEGAVVCSNGESFIIGYQGGTGNDVTLTRTDAAKHATFDSQGHALVGNGSRIDYVLLEQYAAQHPIQNSGFVAPSRPDLLDTDGISTLVRVTASDVPTVQSNLESLGFVTSDARPDLHIIEGMLPINVMPQIEGLASIGLEGVLPSYLPEYDAGAVTSQGDGVLHSDRVRSTAPYYDGTGVR